MKKWICMVLCLMLVGLVAVTATAAPEGPQITRQPQNYSYPEYSVALYTVEATGTNLNATWYIEYEGKTYKASQIGGSMQPWEAYAGESYGAKKLDDNTFCFVFEGIEEELNGAQIWCEIEDGHYSVTSQFGYITVGDYGSPPEILSIPASITVAQGEEAEIRCVAKSADGTQLNYIWYETETGKLQDMRAVDRGAETGDYMFCDTSTVGTCYYVCGISTSGGGMAYSSMVEVNVVAKATTAAPEIQTDTLPEAVVGEAYNVKLSCTDSAAEFAVSYNPGKANDFEKTGLTLAADGTISGTPKTAGTFSFTVCAGGAGGEDYKSYTLTIGEVIPQETTLPETTAGDTIGQETGGAAEQPTEATVPTATEDTIADDGEDDGIPWWVLLLIGLGATGAGVGVAVLLVKKKS